MCLYICVYIYIYNTWTGLGTATGGLNFGSNKDTGKLIFVSLLRHPFSNIRICCYLFATMAVQPLGFSQLLYQGILQIISSALKQLELEAVCLFPLQIFGVLSAHHKSTCL